MTKIFISYRRADSAATTGRIYDRLVKRFGRSNVFIDVDTIPVGMDFKQSIDGMIDQCDAELVVIGKTWIDVTNDVGQRRLDNPDDVVRQEVEAGLKRGVPVIPILVDGAVLPQETQLPASLTEVARREAVEVQNTRDFEAHMQRVLGSIERQSLTFHREQVQTFKLRGWRHELILLGRSALLLGRAAARVFAIIVIVLGITSVILAVLVYVRVNSPQQLTYLPTMQSSDIAMVSNQEGWAVGTQGRIWHLTQPAGQSQPQWNQVDSNITTDLSSVAMVSAQDGWAVGKGGMLLHYIHNDGPFGHIDEWTPSLSPTKHDLFGIVMVSASEGWAVGAAGTILHDSNNTWSLVNPPASCDLRAIALDTPHSGWAVGSTGCLEQYGNNAWTTVSSTQVVHIGFDLYAVALAHSGTGWAVGSAGTGGAGNELFVFHSTGQQPGSDWRVSYLSGPGLASKGLHGVALLPSGEAWAVGDGGLVAHYVNQHWVQVTSSTAVDITGIAMITPTEGWALGVSGRFFHLQNSTWPT